MLTIVDSSSYCSKVAGSTVRGRDSFILHGIVGQQAAFHAHGRGRRLPDMSDSARCEGSDATCSRVPIVQASTLQARGTLGVLRVHGRRIGNRHTKERLFGDSKVHSASGGGLQRPGSGTTVAFKQPRVYYSSCGRLTGQVTLRFTSFVIRSWQTSNSECDLG